MFDLMFTVKKYMAAQSRWNMSRHFEIIQEKVTRDVSIYYNEGAKVEKLTDCRLLYLDGDGVTFEDKAKLGKNRIKYIPSFKLVMIEQELI